MSEVGPGERGGDGLADGTRRVSTSAEQTLERRAAQLGHRLAGLVDDPDAFLETLQDGIGALADPEYRALTERVSPGVESTFALRGPVREALLRPVRRALSQGSSASALYLAQRLAGADDRDLRLYALPCLRRSLHDDPERSWQLLRRMAARAADWIEVDSLAEVWAVGILAEAFRWAELEQLVYSPRPYERRLVGATLATLPHRVPAPRRAELRDELARRSLDLIALLMGDAEVMVQKALSWAIRNWTRVEPRAVADLLEAEAALAVRDADGARAWVIRDSLSPQPPELAAQLRVRLTGLRRDPRARSTSLAARRSAAFAAFIDTHDGVARQGDRSTRIQA
jgi:3-methyladenine DNA glycosylase AlkD